jgi:lysophospholipase L1-like esterase
VCSGGSTTFDLLAQDDAHAWPALLQQLLREQHIPADVWNSGFPGWTSLENVIALALRDLDRHPDIAILYQGFNDLQPASSQPFDSQYVGGHADVIVRALGLVPMPLHWYDHSVLLDVVRHRLRGNPGVLGADPTDGRRDRIPDAAVQTFARNVRSFAAIAGSQHCITVLATQPVHIRTRHRVADLVGVQWWIRGLKGDAVPHELERLNDVLRRLANGTTIRLADAARDVDWTDDDFSDGVHYSAAGSAKLARYFADRVSEILRGQDS